MAAQQISVRSQSGEATEITKLKIMLNVEQDGQDEMCCAVRAFREKLLAEGLTFVLAGGLNAENVAEGIRIFAPDVADVSSGVETLCDGTMAKSIIKIKEFKKSVQKTEGV